MFHLTPYSCIGYDTEFEFSRKEFGALISLRSCQYMIKATQNLIRSPHSIIQILLSAEDYAKACGR